jgi:hypothetical protein
MLVVDTFTYNMRSSEVQRCSFYFGYFTKWDTYSINRSIVISVNSKNIVENGRGGVSYTGKIEETVIG